MCDPLYMNSRRFIWSGGLERKVHLIKWGTIIQNKRNGGLEVHRARHQHTSLLGKLIWDILHNSDKPWAQIVNRKYDTNDLEDLLECSGSYLITSLNNAYTNLKNGYCTIAFKIQLFGTVKCQVNS